MAGTSVQSKVVGAPPSDRFDLHTGMGLTLSKALQVWPKSCSLFLLPARLLLATMWLLQGMMGKKEMRILMVGLDAAVRSVTFSFLWDFSRFHVTNRDLRD